MNTTAPLQFVSSSQFISKVYRDLGLTSEIRHTDILEWLGEVMQDLEIGQQMENKKTEFEVENYRGILPCDVYYIQKVIVDDQIFKLGSQDSPWFLPESSYMTGDDKTLSVQSNVSHRAIFGTFYIEYPYITFNVRNGKCKLFYQGYRLDKNGLPLVPDDTKFTEAAFFYVLYKLKTPDYHTGKISFNEWVGLKQNYNEQLKEARRSMTFPTPEDFERMTRSFRDIYPRIITESSYYPDDVGTHFS